MKRIITKLAVALFFAAGLSAQVLETDQMKNTAWVGFGSPLNGDPTIYGFTDTFQTRFDRGKFTVEAMLNWSFLANLDNDYNVDYFWFGSSNNNPLSIKYGRHDKDTNPYGVNNAANITNTEQESYYVNFLYNITKNFRFGVGTNLNWKVGPAPSYGNWLWEHGAHIRQGGFSTAYDDRGGAKHRTSEEPYGYYHFTPDAPGAADVVGFVHYANKYAKRALGLRYVADNGIIDAGAVLPNGFNTDDPVINTGIKVAPVNWLSVAAAFEGLLDDGANFYTGATIGTDRFVLDVYLAFDSLFTKAEDDQSYGTGLALTLGIPNTSISLRPELGVNFFENDNYTVAWYTGIQLNIPINQQFGFGVWSSIAFGSSDNRWKDRNLDWDGGHIFDIRPEITFALSKQTVLAAYADYENRTAFDGKSRDCWASGLFVTYSF